MANICGRRNRTAQGRVVHGARRFGIREGRGIICLINRDRARPTSLDEPWLNHGKTLEAGELLHKAMRLSPKDPMLPMHLLHVAVHHFFEERYDEACVWAQKALHAHPNFPSGYRLLTTAHGMADNLAEARAAYERLAQLVPGVTIVATLAAVPFAFDDDAEQYAEGLRRAGMPE